MNRLKGLFLLASALAIGLFVGVGHGMAQSTVPSTQAIFESIGYKLTLSGKIKVTVESPFGQAVITKTVTVRVDSGNFELGRNRVLGQRSLDSAVLTPLLDDNPEAAVAAANAILPFLNSLSTLGFQVPNAAFPERNVRLMLDIRNFALNIDQPDSVHIAPILVDGDPIPIFFFMRLAMERDGKILEQFDFKPGSPLTLRLPLGTLRALLDASGYVDVPFSDLLLAFASPTDIEREGVFTEFDGESNELIVRTTHLGDLVGLRASDVPPPKPPAITQGPAAVTDTTFATIVWRTDRTATSQVRYASSKAALATADSVANSDDALGVLAHTVRINDLNRSTRYFYHVWSVDGLGRRVASPVDSFKTRGISDLAAPVFSVRPFVRDRNPNNATIVWGTDRLAVGSVLFDTTKALTNKIGDTNPVVAHSITIAGLTAGKKYFFLVASSAGGATLTSDTLTFNTPAVQDTTPLVITVPSRVDGFAVTDTTSLIQWRTNFPSNSQVIYWEPGTTDTASAFLSDNITDHTVVLTGLKKNTQYRYFARSSRGATGQIVNGAPDGFKTKKSDEIPPLRFVESPGVVYRTNDRIVIGWKTNLPSDGFVYYQRVAAGVTTLNADSALVRGNAELKSKHSVTVGGLTAGANYVFVTHVTQS